LAKTNALVFVLAASNIPWELDMALLRRLEKRVLVSLPDEPARLSMLEKLLGGGGGGKELHPLSAEVDLKEVAARTHGFSGSDIRLLCKEVAMKPVRRMMFVLEEMEMDPARNGKVATEQEVAAVRASDPITKEDMEQALRATNPASNTKYTEKYREWEKGFGAV
jgi:katanin p60 ATPase-containing subunit A1